MAEIELRGDGVRLAASVRGPATGPPVVLLPGGGQTRSSWSSTAQRLAADGWRAVAVDLRGHGGSEWAPDGDYTADAVARDLERVLDQLAQPAVVIGASIGGIGGLLACGGDARRSIVALVLVDVATRHEPEGIDRILRFMTSAPDGFATVEEAAEAVATYTDRPAPRRLDGLRRNLRRRDDGRWVWHWDPTFMWPGWRDGRTDETRAVTDPLHLRRAAGRVRVPTLLVRGARSDLVTADGARELLELVPHAEYVDVQGAGHMVVGDDNDRFASAVLGFLARVEAA